MQRLTFDELFALLSAATLSATAPARLQEWIANAGRPARCNCMPAYARCRALEHAYTLVACRN